LQFAASATLYRIPATYSGRDYVAVGGMMSYGTDQTDMFRQVGIYAGNVLKGTKPADLPVVQSTKFEFVINLKTAKALGPDDPRNDAGDR
jgi:putative ABC transport system substrate-binding protein